MHAILLICNSLSYKICMKIPGKIRLTFGQCKRKHRSISGFAAHANRLLMRFDNVFANGETKTCTTMVSGSAFINAVEAFKKARLVGLGNSGAVVFNFY